MIDSMFGPSGFFLTSGPEESPVSSSDLELIHSSENGFNVLYRGSKNGRFFIYKALKPEFIGNILYEDLLKKEFDLGFSLTHHAICQYYALVTLPGIGSCIVMEWIDGQNLEQMIASGEVDNDLAAKIIGEICDALDYMHHKQVIHRDLKPENIIITHNGRNVKIIDFGLSDSDSYNAFKAPAGTKIYASPELLAGEVIDNRSDIYSLGMIINEMNSRYRGIAAKCLRRDRSRRYANAADIKRDIRLYPRRRVLRCLVSVLAVLAAASILFFIYGQKPSDIPQTVEIPSQPDTLELVQPEVLLQQDRNIPASRTQTKEKAAESIDPATLDNLFEEASIIIK